MLLRQLITAAHPPINYTENILLFFQNLSMQYVTPTYKKKEKQKQTDKIHHFVSYKYNKFH